MSKVLVTCHNPSSDGNVEWAGYEIVGYVGVTAADDTSNVIPNAPYYNGWNTIPKGTAVDVVLGMFCPVGFAIYDPDVANAFGEEGSPANEIFRKGFSYVKPGGHMLFPIDKVAADTAINSPAFQSEFGAKNMKFVKGTRGLRKLHPGYMESLDGYTFFVITKPSSGGRRRKTRRARRSKKTLRRRR